MEEELIKKFFIADFEGIDILLENLEINKQKDILIKLAFQTESLSIYAYINHRIFKEKSGNIIPLYAIAMELLMSPFCFIEGAYSSAFYYAKQILKLEPNDIGNLEQMLFFYDIPEKLLSQKEAIKIAKKIIEVEKDNELAIRFLNNLSNKINYKEEL